MWWLLSMSVLAGCASGSLVFPGGTTDLRTAVFRSDRVGGVPRLLVFLSNSELPCGFPEGDAGERRETLAEMQLGVCREDARHVGLAMYQRSDGAWTGFFPAEAGANPAALSADRPRLAGGGYFGVEEAFLIQVDGLERLYTPSEEIFVPDLGDGAVTLDDRGERLDGSLRFDDAGVFGDFRASACPSHDGLLELLVEAPLRLCP